MFQAAENIDILEYLEQHEQKELLRFITCGSVDDGKSTLIGRLLHDSKLIYEDQLNAIKRDSEKVGTTGQGNIDLALLVDGLQAEREQGITIDVAYRYFSTDKRKFIIADTPGHEQYTRNMATGASNSQLAILMIDARHGVLTQTKRHSFIASLLGIPHIVVAINKMDLVDFSEERFHEIAEEYKAFAKRVNIDLETITMVPVSALNGDNVVEPSENIPWYKGDTLLHHLETVNIADDRNFESMRFPVQYVNRPNLDFRGFAGTLGSGIVRKGDEIMALPSRKTTKIKDIVTFDGSLEEATPPLAITLVTEDEIDISRGEMIVHPHDLPQVDREFEAMVVWMSDEPMKPEKSYFIKNTTNVVRGTFSKIHYALDINTLEKQSADQLDLNAVARCHVNLGRAICFDAYEDNPSTGAFIIIDQLTNITVGAGVIVSGRENAENRAFWEDAVEGFVAVKKADRISTEEREAAFKQKATTVILSGLPGSGRNDVAAALERRLVENSHIAVMISSDQFKNSIENISKSVGLLKSAGLITVLDCSVPVRNDRNLIRKEVGPDHALTISITTSDSTSKKRLEEKGGSPDSAEFQKFEPTKGADLEIDLEKTDVDSAVDQIIHLLEQKRFLF